MKALSAMNEKNASRVSSRTALITGATGFAGSHLARRLVQDGWRVHILIRTGSIVPTASEFSQITVHSHDGTTADMISCLSLAKPDVVFHLASLILSQHHAEDIEPMIQSNILFGTQLLEAMQANGVKHIVNTGTSWQHFNNEDYNPVCLYAATKQAFEALLEYYVQACGLKAITLKLFDTYGSDDLRPKLFHLLNKASSSGEQLDMSEGDQFIDIVHINDVIDAYLVAAERLSKDKVSQHESYAVSSGQPLRLKELVQLYSEVTKKAINVNWGARPYRFREVMTTWSNGKSIENWTPKIDLCSGFINVSNGNISN